MLDAVNNKKWKILSVLTLMVLLYAFWYWISTSSRFAIEEVRVHGEFKYQSVDELREQVLAQVNGNFFSVELEALRDTIEQLPWVMQAKIKRVWPNAIDISIYEQMPIAIWNDEAFVNLQGVVFGSTQTHQLSDLPVLAGPDHARRYLLEQLGRLHEKFASYQLQFKRIDLDERRSMTITLDNNCRLLLGRRDIEERLTQFFHLYRRELKPRMGELERVDLRYSSGAAVSWKRLSANKVGGPWENELKNA